MSLDVIILELFGISCRLLTWFCPVSMAVQLTMTVGKKNGMSRRMAERGGRKSVDPTADPQRRGYSKLHKAKTINSSRARAVFNRMEKARHRNPDSSHSLRREEKKKKKTSKMKEIVVDPRYCKTPSEADGLWYRTGEEPDLHIVHTNVDACGRVHWYDKDNEVFTVLVIPRVAVLCTTNDNNNKEVTSALDIHQKCGDDCERGKKAGGHSERHAKHVVCGVTVQQGRRGHGLSKAYRSHPGARQRVIKWAKRLQHLAFQWVPTQWIRSIVRTGSECQWPTLGKGVTFFAAMASSIDFSAPAHVDADFLFSVHQLNVGGSGHLTIDSPVAQYFCFPQQGFAIAMRPGDVILFNSNVFHCLTGKTEAYIKERVYVTSFYLKTGHVSGNDNSRELSQDELEYLRMDFG